MRPLIRNETDFAWYIEDNKIQLMPSLKQQLKPTEDYFQFTKIYDESATNTQIFE